MSVTYYSRLVVGVMIDRVQFLGSRQVRNCSHTVSGSPRFCPECGRPFLRDVSLSEIQEEFDEAGSKLSFYASGYPDESVKIIVGRLFSEVCEDNDPQAFELPGVDIFAKVFGDLVKHNLVSSLEDVKMFNVLQCSY